MQILYTVLSPAIAPGFGAFLLIGGLMKDVWDRIHDLLEEVDGHLEIGVASECCWSGELRIGLTNPDNAPARNMTFFSVGHGDPTSVARRLLADYEDWRRGEIT
jgi:hypothetical protein